MNTRSTRKLLERLAVVGTCLVFSAGLAGAPQAGAHGVIGGVPASASASTGPGGGLYGSADAAERWREGRRNYLGSADAAERAAESQA